MADGLTRYEPDLAQFSELLDGLPDYRSKQLWEGLYQQHRVPAEMTNLPKDLRAKLDAELPPALEEVGRSVSEGGATVKVLWRLHDGSTIESVLMHQQGKKSEWSTVCISSQAGCAMGCGFCATGQIGLDRNLTTGEIVEQVVWAAREAAPRRLSNVVFMGMGEPLANYSRTWRAVRRMHEAMGLSARKLTISTVGVVPGIRRMTDEGLPVNLAVSLHAANDGLRTALVPINERYPIAELLDACEHWSGTTGRRLSFEWAMIADTNDRDADADELAAISRSLRAHINLIPLNPTPGFGVVGTTPARIRAFRDRLVANGVNATIRRTRGTDIDAACGQLRANHDIAPAATVSVAPPRVRRSDDRGPN